MHFLLRALVAGSFVFAIHSAAAEETAPPANPAPKEQKPAVKLNPLLEACLKPNEAETVVVACTTAIESRQFKGDDLAAALFRRGIAQARRGQSAAAVNDFSAALKQTPGAVDVLTARARIYASMSRHDLAVTDYDAILKAAPSDADSLYFRAWSLTVLGRDEAAIADLSALLKIVKNDQDALKNRGGLYLRQGKFAEAIADFSAVVTQDPKMPLAYYNRGRAKFLKGDYAAAAKDFAEAKKVWANNPYAALRQYLASGQGKEKPQAKILADAIAAFPPEQWPIPILMTLAGKTPEKDLLAEAAVDNRSVAAQLAAEAHYYLGEAALLKKDTKAARAHFEAAATGDRNLPESIDAGWRLKQIP